MTASAFHELCALVKCKQQEATSRQEQVQLDMQTPFVPYKRSILEEISEDAPLSKDESSIKSSIDERIIEPLQDQSQDQSQDQPQDQSQDITPPMDELIICKDTTDQ